MPQLPSGRHVGLSNDRLFAWAEDEADIDELGDLIDAAEEPQRLLALIDLTYYRASPAASASGGEPGEAYPAGITAADFDADDSDWSEADIAFFRDWLEGQRAQEWLLGVREDLAETLESRTLTDSAPAAD